MNANQKDVDTVKDSVNEVVRDSNVIKEHAMANIVSPINLLARKEE